MGVGSWLGGPRWLGGWGLRVVTLTGTRKSELTRFSSKFAPGSTIRAEDQEAGPSILVLILILILNYSKLSSSANRSSSSSSTTSTSSSSSSGIYRPLDWHEDSARPSHDSPATDVGTTMASNLGFITDALHGQP